MKTYSNASNAARAAKATLSAQLGLDKAEIVRGTHFEVREAEMSDGFIWYLLTERTEVKMTLPTIPEQLNAKREALVVEPVAKATGIKIQKDRETRNDVTRPSAGGACAAVWEACDKLHAEGLMPKPALIKPIAQANGWNTNNAVIEMYQWRKFMGIRGRQK